MIISYISTYARVEDSIVNSIGIVVIFTIANNGRNNEHASINNKSVMLSR